MSSRRITQLLAPVLSLALALPATAWASPPEPEPEPADDVAAEGEAVADDEAPRGAGVVVAEDGSHPGGDYGETVDYDWDHSDRPAPPDAGPHVTIEVHNSLSPVYLRRSGGSGDVEVCEAPCNQRIGDAGGTFVLTGPGRKSSKPFSLTSGDSLRLVAKGGKPSRAALGVIALIIGIGGGVALAVTPTQVNMPKTAGIAMWAGAGALAAVGLTSGFLLFRFSRTQVKVLPAA